jgi:hypothetical protein
VTSPGGNYQFSYNGWLFGGLGQGVQVLEVEGLEDMPGLRVQDDIRGYLDGMFTGRDFLNARSITFTLQIMNDSANTMQTYLAQLKANLLYQQSGTGVLQFQLPGRAVQRVSARVRRRSLKVDPEYVYGRAIAYVELFCPDPRIYDDSLQTLALTPFGGLGRTYNRVYPLLYNTATGVSGNIGTVTNSGNVTSYPTFTITGPLTTAIIRNITTGDILQLSASLLASDTVVIDSDLRAITLNGDPARNLLTNSSNWFGLEPGSTTIAFTSTSYSSGASCAMTFRSAYV